MNRDVRLVVLDAYGVMYDQRGVEEPLIPFLREQGCDLPEAEIWQHHFAVQLGRTSYPEFWKRIGISVSPSTLYEKALELCSPMPGLFDFLLSMRDLRIPVACLSNDAGDLSLRMRQKHSLEPFVSHWVISGDVGVRKPDAAIFQLLLSRASVLAQDTLFVDDRAENLDAAKKLGFNTVHFRELNAGTAGAHFTVSSFAELSTAVTSLLTRPN